MDMDGPDVYDLVGQTSPDGADPDGTVKSGYEREDYPYRTVRDFRTAAYNGEFPDERLPMPDRVYFWAMRDMYARYKAGKITKEQGEAELASARKTYYKDRARYDGYVAMTEHVTSLWKTIEAAATDYAKSNGRTPEADAFYAAVYGSKPKDKR